MEVMRLQALQAEVKKEASNTTPATETPGGDSKPPEKTSATTTGKDFVE